MSFGQIPKIAARLIAPIIFIFGFYIILHGHLSPGGGFQGGAVMATGVALILVAFTTVQGQEFLPSLKNIKLIETAGLILFICTALMGIVLASGFMVNTAGGLFGNTVGFGITAGDLWTARGIPILNFAVGIEVFGALSVVLLYMIKGLKEKSDDDKIKVGEEEDKK